MSDDFMECANRQVDADLEAWDQALDYFRGLNEWYESLDSEWKEFLDAVLEHTSSAGIEYVTTRIPQSIAVGGALAAGLAIGESFNVLRNCGDKLF